MIRETVVESLEDLLPNPDAGKNSQRAVSARIIRNLPTEESRKSKHFSR